MLFLTLGWEAVGCIYLLFPRSNRVEAPPRSARPAAPGRCPVAQDILEVSVSNEVGAEAPLYRHSKRPRWGVAIKAWERDDYSAYQFEDGQLRKFRSEYERLLVPADDLGDRADQIRTNLRRVVNAGGPDAGAKVIDAVSPFSDQVELFIRLYPQGFQDPEWIEDHRESDGAALKRHR